MGKNDKIIHPPDHQVLNIGDLLCIPVGVQDPELILAGILLLKLIDRFVGPPADSAGPAVVGRRYCDSDLRNCGFLGCTSGEDDSHGKYQRENDY